MIGHFSGYHWTAWTAIWGKPVRMGDDLLNSLFVPAILSLDTGYEAEGPFIRHS